MRRLLLPAAMALAACTTIIGPEPSTRADALFDEVWQEFDRHYSFFELKQVDWNTLRAQHRPSASATDAQLFGSLRLLVDALNDPHVVLRTPLGFHQSGRSTTPTYFSSTTVFSNYVTGALMTPSRRMRYGRLAPTIGYVWIANFGGEGWGREIDGILDDLDGIQALVFDVRDNGGGDNTIAMEIAGRFTAVPRLASWFRYRNGPRHSDFTDFIAHELRPRGTPIELPIVVLTNRRVASSGEDFVLMLHALPNATQIGDSTMGASGNPLMREMSNGWSYQLSEWIAYTPDKQPFEEVGLVPSIVVKAIQSDSVARIDRALERAILHLSQP